MKWILAIDFGTTATAIAEIEEASTGLEPEIVRINGEETTDSVLRLDKNLRDLEDFCQLASKKQGEFPDSTFVDFKLYLRPETACVSEGGVSVRGDDLILRFLTALREQIQSVHLGDKSLDHRVSRTVIGHPVCWTGADRDAMAQLVRDAGFPNPIAHEEPNALLYGSLLQNDLDIEQETAVLVCAIGGGTTDVSVVRVMEDLSLHHLGSGELRLGDRDIDQQLFHHFLKQLTPDSDRAFSPRDRVEILASCVRLKDRLSENPTGKESTSVRLRLHDAQVKDPTLRLSQADLRRICAHQFEQFRRPIHDALRHSGVGPGEIDLVVLGGGGSRTAAIRALLREEFPQLVDQPSRLVAAARPELAVAEGLAIFGRAATDDTSPLSLLKKLAEERSRSNRGQPEDESGDETIRGIVNPRKRSWFRVALLCLAFTGIAFAAGNYAYRRFVGTSEPSEESQRMSRNMELLGTLGKKLYEEGVVEGSTAAIDAVRVELRTLVGQMESSPHGPLARRLFEISVELRGATQSKNLSPVNFERAKLISRLARQPMSSSEPIMEFKASPLEIEWSRVVLSLFQWQYDYCQATGSRLFDVRRVVLNISAVAFSEGAFLKYLGPGDEAVEKGFFGDYRAGLHAEVLPDPYLLCIVAGCALVDLTGVKEDDAVPVWNPSKGQDLYVPSGRLTVLVADRDNNSFSRQDDVLDRFEIALPLEPSTTLEGDLGSLLSFTVSEAAEHEAGVTHTRDPPSPVLAGTVWKGTLLWTGTIPEPGRIPAELHISEAEGSEFRGILVVSFRSERPCSTEIRGHVAANRVVFQSHNLSEYSGHGSWFCMQLVSADELSGRSYCGRRTLKYTLKMEDQK